MGRQLPIDRRRSAREVLKLIGDNCLDTRSIIIIIEGNVMSYVSLLYNIVSGQQNKNSVKTIISNQF